MSTTPSNRLTDIVGRHRDDLLGEWIRVQQSETAMFVFSLKEPLFARLSNEFQDDAVGLISVILETTTLIEQMVVLTIDEYQKGREAAIHHGQHG